MVYKYPKTDERQLSPHFKLSEFHCRCSYPECTYTLISEYLIKNLELLRALANQPIHIDCGYRCQKHNADVGGKPNSQHLLGVAADIKIGELTPKKIISLAKKVTGFNRGGIGLYPTFVHLDLRGHAVRWIG